MLGKLVCNDRIVLEKIIERGDFIDIYKGIDKITKEVVAVKVMEKSVINQFPVLKTLFTNEIKSLRVLNSTNIVKYIDDEETPERYYLVIEFCDEGKLASKLQTNERFNEKTAFGYFCQILNAQQELHKKHILHRNITLDNIMINQGVLKLVNLECSKQFETRNLDDQLTSTIIGTPISMAPELLLNQPYIGVKTEIYALGVLLYQMLTGKPPFLYSNQILQDDVELAKIIEKGNINFDFQSLEKKQVQDYSISNETRELIKKMLAYKDRLSFKELYQNPKISKIINIDQYRDEGVIGIGPEFKPSESIEFYKQFEKEQQIQNQSKKPSQKQIFLGPPQFNYQTKLTISQEREQILSNDQKQKVVDEPNLRQIIQNSEEKQEKNRKSKNKLNVFYEQYLNQMILLLNNLYQLQKSRVGFVNSCFVGQAFILVKAFKMAQKLKIGMEQELNIFNLKNFEDILQTMQYKNLKSQVLNNYYGEVELNFQFQIDEYIQNIHKDTKEFIQITVLQLQQQKQINDAEFEQNYNEQMNNYYKELKDFLDSEQEQSSIRQTIGNESFEILIEKKNQNIYKLLFNVLFSIQVEKQFPPSIDKAFNFQNFSERIENVFESQNWQQEVQQIQQCHEYILI